MLKAKRLMAIVLMLAMLVTMTSFPAFAGEPAKITISSYSSTAKFPASRPLSNAFDGDWTTSFKYNAWFSSSTTKGSSGSIKIDMVLDGSYNISTLTMAQDVSANKYYFTKFAVYVSEDGATWIEVADFNTGVPEKTDYAISHEGYYQYVRFEGYAIGAGGGSPVVNEFELYGTQPDAEPVEYKIVCVDAEGSEIQSETKSGYDGMVATATAPAIDGYKLTSEAAASITLDKDAAENKITFTYKKLAVLDYTVEFVDEEGNPVADAVTGSDYEGTTITATAEEILGYELTGEATASIVLAVDGTNKITFVYETLPVVFYEVKYVDENGKEIAPTKTDVNLNGATVTEIPANVAGYMATVASKDLVIDENGTNVITFEYVAIPRKEAGKLALTAANISWESMCKDTNVCKDTIDAIVDGVIEATSSTLGFMASTHYRNKTDEIIIDLGALYNVDTLKIYWGNAKNWNLTPSGIYTVALAGADGVYGEPIYSYEDPKATNPGSNTIANRNDTIELTGTADFVQYIKIISTNNFDRRLVVREIEVYGDEAIVSSNAATVTVEHYDVDDNKIADDIFTVENLGTVMDITPTEIDGYKYVGTAELNFELTEHAKDYFVKLVYEAIPNVVGVPAEEAYFATNSSNVPFVFSISTPTNASPADVFAAANWVVDNAEIASVSVTANDDPATLVYEWNIVVNVKPNDNTAFEVVLDLPAEYELTDKVRFYREASDTLLDSAIASGENKITLDKTSLTIEYNASGDITTSTNARTIYVTVDVQSIIDSELPYMGYDDLVVELTEIIANGDRSRLNLKNFVRLGDQYVGNATINKTGLERFEATVTLYGVNADGSKTPLKNVKIYSDIVDVAAKYPAVKTQAQTIKDYTMPLDIIDQLFDQVHPFDLPTFTDAEWAFFAEILVARGIDQTSADLEVERIRTTIATLQEAAKDPNWVAPDYNEENVYIVNGTLVFKKTQTTDENGDPITVSKPAHVVDKVAFDTENTNHYKKAQRVGTTVWNMMKDLHTDTFSIQCRLLLPDDNQKDQHGIVLVDKAYVTFRKGIDFDTTSFDANDGFCMDMKLIGTGGVEYTNKNLWKHYNAVRRVLNDDQLEPVLARVDWYNWGKNPFKSGVVTVQLTESWIENYGAFDLVSYHMAGYKPADDNDPALTLMAEDIDVNLETREVSVEAPSAAKLYDTFVFVPTDKLPSELPETIGVYYDIAE